MGRMNSLALLVVSALTCACSFALEDERPRQARPGRQASALADGEEALSPNRRRMGLSGALSRIDDFGSASSLDVQVDMGWRFGRFEFGPLAEVNLTHRGSYRVHNSYGDVPSSTAWTLLVGPQARFYFRDNARAQPWISLAAGGAYSDFSGGSDEADFFTRLGVGVSFFSSKWTALELSLSTTDWLDNDIRADVDAQLLLGISTFF